jgi:cytochrome P450 family 4
MPKRLCPFEDSRRIAKGTVATVFIYQIHRDPTHYPDPEKFLPKRFLPENSVNRHLYAYLPFSTGKCNCVGQRFTTLEEKILLAHLAQLEISCAQAIDNFHYE